MTKLKVVKVREAKDGAFVRHKLLTGDPYIAVRVSQQVHDLIGEEMMWMDERVTVVAPDLLDDELDEVIVLDSVGRMYPVDKSELEPIPQTQTVTMEVVVGTDEDLDNLVVVHAPPRSPTLPRRITHIDGEEVGDD